MHIGFKSIRCCCCCCSVAKLCLTLCNPMDCSTAGFPVLQYLPEFVKIHIHWVGDTIQPSHSLPSSSPFASNLSQHQSLSSGSILCIRWPKYWSFNFSISLSSEYWGLISSRFTSLISLKSKGLKSLKAPILWCSAFCVVQLSHMYMTTGNTMALPKWTFVGKVMSLLFNTKSRFVTAFLPRSTWLFMAAVTICSDFGAQENKICHCFHFFTFYLP